MQEECGPESGKDSVCPQRVQTVKGQRETPRHPRAAGTGRVPRRAASNEGANPTVPGSVSTATSDPADLLQCPGPTALSWPPLRWAECISGSPALGEALGTPHGNTLSSSSSTGWGAFVTLSLSGVESQEENHRQMLFPQGSVLVRGTSVHMAGMGAGHQGGPRARLPNGLVLQ